MTTGEAQQIGEEIGRPLSLEEYVRMCAGLGLAVRVFTWQCRECRQTTSVAQPFAAVVADDLRAIVEIDRIILDAHGTPKHCGKPMRMLDPITRKGALLA